MANDANASGQLSPFHIIFYATKADAESDTTALPQSQLRPGTIRARGGRYPRSSLCIDARRWAFRPQHWRGSRRRIGLGNLQVAAVMICNPSENG